MKSVSSVSGFQTLTTQPHRLTLQVAQKKMDMDVFRGQYKSDAHAGHT